MKKFWKTVLYIISFKWWEDLKRESVDSKCCDFSGEGRDKYGL